MGKYSSQPASVELGHPLPQLCMQRAAFPLKNACIFEKHENSPLSQYLWYL